MPTAALNEEDKPSKSLLTWHFLSAQTDIYLVFNLKEKNYKCLQCMPFVCTLENRQQVLLVVLAEGSITISIAHTRKVSLIELVI